MKLLHIGSSWPDSRPGGIPRYFYELTTSLAGRGHEVIALAAGKAPIASAGLLAQSLGLLDTSRPRRWLATRRLASEALAQGFIPCLHYLPHSMALIDLLRCRPYVLYFHGPASLEAGIEGRGKLYCHAVDLLERSFYQRAAMVTCLSAAFGQIITDHYGVDPQRVVIIPGGLGDRWFAPIPDLRVARTSLGWSASKIHILTVRRLVRRVGIDRLLQALALPGKLNSVILHIVGEGSLRTELEQLVLSLDLGDTVRFYGRVSDQVLQNLYAAADFTVVPSLALEGFGMAVVESLALGTPVLATPVGGLPEILRPFDPRCVTGDTSPDALREGILAMLAFAGDSVYRNRCRDFARKQYNWSELAARHEKEIYRYVAERGPVHQIRR